MNIRIDRTFAGDLIVALIVGPLAVAAVIAFVILYACGPFWITEEGLAGIAASLILTIIVWCFVDLALTLRDWRVRLDPYHTA